MTTVYHASGTNKMGSEADESAVVDSGWLDVWGSGAEDRGCEVRCPFPPPGHPQSVVYAPAEKLADSILGRSE